MYTETQPHSSDAAVQAFPTRSHFNFEVRPWAARSGQTGVGNKMASYFADCRSATAAGVSPKDFSRCILIMVHGLLGEECIDDDRIHLKPAL